MARLIRTDGTEAHVTPKRGNRWTLLELQQHVGGYIEEMPGVGGLRILFDEEGQLKNLPFNAVATAIVMEAVLAEAQRRGCGLRYQPRIVGNALVLEPGERM
jgi:hypothetical protein